MISAVLWVKLQGRWFLWLFCLILVCAVFVCFGRFAFLWFWYSLWYLCRFVRFVDSSGFVFDLDFVLFVVVAILLCWFCVFEFGYLVVWWFCCWFMVMPLWFVFIFLVYLILDFAGVLIAWFAGWLFVPFMFGYFGLLGVRFGLWIWPRMLVVCVSDFGWI